MSSHEGNNFTLFLENPYKTALKYDVFMIKEVFIKKGAEFVNYYQHSKKESVQGLFCINNRHVHSQVLTSSIVKQLFRIDGGGRPVEMELERVNKVYKVRVKQAASSEDQASNNSWMVASDYASSQGKKGANQCYSMQMSLYLRLLIETELPNMVLEEHSHTMLEQFIEKEYSHIKKENIKELSMLRFENFYHDLRIRNLSAYCEGPVFPVFRFCSHFHLEMVVGGAKKEPTLSNPKPGKLTTGPKGNRWRTLNAFTFSPTVI